MDLSKLHTKQLLKLKQKTYKFGGLYKPYEASDCVITTNDIKAELANREHIPNKRESRAIRQGKAKNRFE